MANQATHLPISLTVLQHFKLTHLFPTTLLVTFTSTTTHLRKNINFDLNIDEPSLISDYPTTKSYYYILWSLSQASMQTNLFPRIVRSILQDAICYLEFRSQWNIYSTWVYSNIYNFLQVMSTKGHIPSYGPSKLCSGFF